jgi:hypothetical protein
MPAEIDSAVRPCAACGHAATLHSNEACEAIRCNCHLTRKMLVRATKQRSAEPVPTAQPVAAEPLERTRPRHRRRRRAAQSVQDVAVVA